MIVEQTLRLSVSPAVVLLCRVSHALILQRVRSKFPYNLLTVSGHFRCRTFHRMLFRRNRFIQYFLIERRFTRFTEDASTNAVLSTVLLNYLAVVGGMKTYTHTRQATKCNRENRRTNFFSKANWYTRFTCCRRGQMVRQVSTRRNVACETGIAPFATTNAQSSLPIRVIITTELNPWFT